MQSSLFCRGSQLAPFVISSGLLRLSWNAITSSDPSINSNQGVRFSYKLHSVRFHGKTLKIIAFETPDNDVQVDLVSSSDLKKENFLDFEFLCTELYPEFSVNKTVVSLLQENHQILVQLKDQIIGSTALIVTGSGLAGSVASLFTLSLLDTIEPGDRRPLCITFGAPLIGDRKLQQAISRSSTWNSCFLNVVSHKDPLPRLFITNQTTAYMPFGTFLLCSDAVSTYCEYPDFTLELLLAIASTDVQNPGFQYADYGNIVESLCRKVICKDLTTLPENLNVSDSSLSVASISLQLLALGLAPLIQDTNILKRMETLEEKIITGMPKFDLANKLNKEKISMAQLEWYKKKTKNQGTGYYDNYRNINSQQDLQDYVNVGVFMKKLTNFWEKMVEEVEMKPKREGAEIRTRRWLYGGTTYRRMVEPLVIAQFYRENGKDYVTQERSTHFKKLEEWLKEDNENTTQNSTRKHNVESILTLDSCFWAHVEEALIACKELKVTHNEEARNKLVEFEEYVYELLKNYEVSPEIFLPGSSYMNWWKEYKEMKGSSYDSTLASFMNNASNYEDYAKGDFEFPLNVQ